MIYVLEIKFFINNKEFYAKTKNYMHKVDTSSYKINIKGLDQNSDLII